MQYSRIQKFLHWLCLSNKYIPELGFVLEKLLFLEEGYASSGKHLFISGMARSGTTTLLNLFYESKEFASLTYKDMPFLFALNLWDRINFVNDLTAYESKERAHGDGITVSKISPEAFEEVFWMMENINEQPQEFLNFISLVCKKYRKKRYISKNNQNIHRISLILDLLPDSFFLVPFRDPLQQAFSLLKQHKRFMEKNSIDSFVGRYMQWIGHTEFGPAYKPFDEKNLIFTDPFTLDHWLEQWLKCYIQIQNEIEHLNQLNCKLICYEQLGCKTVNIYNLFKWAKIDEYPSLNFDARSNDITENYNLPLLEECHHQYTRMVKSDMCFTN